MPHILLSRRAYDAYADALAAYGYTAVPLDADPTLPALNADHADTLIFRAHTTLLAAKPLIDSLPEPLRDRFIAADHTPHGSYPGDTALNALTVGRHLFARTASLSADVRRAAAAEGLEIVDVKQGYARCSTLPLSAVNAAITADEGMARAMEACGVDVLRITPGHIDLDGRSDGFIGGASFVDEPFCCCSLHMPPLVGFFGSPGSHPDGARIRAFIESHGYRMLTTDGRLRDLGGAVVI